MLRPKYLSTRALMLLLLVAPPSLSRAGIAQGQEVSPVATVDHRSAAASQAPCQDPSTPPALRETLRLVCSRERVDAANGSFLRAIILGFVGGFVKHDDLKHPEVLFGMYLHKRYGSAVHVEIFGNHETKKAVEETIRRLDADKSGVRMPVETYPVKIILYGHSWGASQVLAVARELQRRREIPVALTIQIDSVKKFRQDDRTVPANVAKAINFYQRKGLTPGQPLIVPADAARTTILGNFLMQYEDHQVNCDNYKWLSRVFNKAHHQIENDPYVWDQIVSLIDSELLRTDPERQGMSPAASPPLK